MSAPERLTEAQAWREIARRFARRRAGENRSWGLCYSPIYLVRAGMLTLDDADRMRLRVLDHMEAGQLWAFPIEVTAVRVLAALFLALECEDEENGR